MSDHLAIRSHRGEYRVVFDEEGLSKLGASPPANAHFIVDKRVAELHADTLKGALASRSVLLVEATEEAKAFDKMERYINALLTKSVRRSDILVAIGGGIIQDITCFLATILLRGVPWRFFPTTLLAQADSCMGSKSSINLSSAKNLLGTFYPPEEVTITTRVLSTLDSRDVRSGVGEMLKVHIIDGPRTFDAIAKDYSDIFTSRETMVHYIQRSLEIKKRFAEEDEFDRGIRNVLNYGHSFGHAIESATNFAVPHGIAVTLGMDCANWMAVQMGRMTRDHYARMHPTLAANYAGFERTEIPLEPFFSALAKDKKNTATALRLILPDEKAIPQIVSCTADDTFRTRCIDWIARERTAH